MDLLQELTRNYVQSVGAVAYAAPFRVGLSKSDDVPSPIFRPGRKKSVELLVETDILSPKSNVPQRHGFKKLLAAAQKLEEKQQEEAKASKDHLYVENSEGAAQAGHHRLSLHAFASRNLGLKDSHKKRVYDTKYIEQEYRAISQAIGEKPKPKIAKKRTLEFRNHSEPVFSMAEAMQAAYAEEPEDGIRLEANPPAEGYPAVNSFLVDRPPESVNRAKYLLKPLPKSQEKESPSKFEREIFNEVPQEEFAYSDLLLKHKLVKKLEKSGRKIGQFIFEYKNSIDWPEPGISRQTAVHKNLSKTTGNAFSTVVKQAIEHQGESAAQPGASINKLKSNVKMVMAVTKLTDTYNTLQDAQNKKSGRQQGLLTSKLANSDEDNDGLFQQVVKTAKHIYYNNQSVSNIKNVKSGNFEQLPFADEFKKKFTDMEKQILLSAQNTQNKISMNLQRSKMERKQALDDRPQSPPKKQVASRVFARNKSIGGTANEHTVDNKLLHTESSTKFGRKSEKLPTETSTIAVSMSNQRTKTEKSRIFVRKSHRTTDTEHPFKEKGFRFVVSEESESKGGVQETGHKSGASIGTLMTVPNTHDKDTSDNRQFHTGESFAKKERILPKFGSNMNKYSGNKSSSQMHLSQIPELLRIEERSHRVPQKKFRATFSNYNRTEESVRMLPSQKAATQLETQKSIDDATSVGSVSRDYRSPTATYSNFKLNVAPDLKDAVSATPGRSSHPNRTGLSKLTIKDAAPTTSLSRRGSISPDHVFKSARVFRPPVVDKDKKAKYVQLREFTRDVEQAGAFNKFLNRNYQTYTKQYVSRNFPEELDYEWIFREYATEAESQAVMDKAHKIYMMASPAKRKQILRKCTKGVTVNPGGVRMPEGSPAVVYHRVEN